MKYNPKHPPTLVVTFGFALTALKYSLAYTTVLTSGDRSLSSVLINAIISFDRRFPLVSTHQYVANLGAIHLEYLSLAFNELLIMQAKNYSASFLSKHFSAALFLALITLFTYINKADSHHSKITLCLLLLH